MRMEDIDKNLREVTALSHPDKKWLTPIEADSPLTLHGLYGYHEDHGFVRMPPHIAESVSDGVKWLYKHPTGGRIRFRTNSNYIAGRVYITPVEVIPHSTAIAQCGVDLFANKNGSPTFLYSCRPYPKAVEEGVAAYEFAWELSGEMTTYTLNLPLFSEVKGIYIGLDKDAVVEKAEDYAVAKPVLYYGSSITQGLCASRPGNTYPAMLSRRFDCDFINLGFAGNAKGEPLMAEYLASLDPSVFVLDYDYNADDADHLRATHEPLFKAFRAAHPDTPVIIITKPDLRVEDGDDVRREIIRETYANAVSAGDKNVYFIDGETLFEGRFRDGCTVDGTHPNDLGFFRMAEVIGDVMEPIMESIRKNL